MRGDKATHPHVFVPRKHGSRAACGFDGCGAPENDPIHVKPEPVPAPHTWPRRRGQALVEFALVTPLLLFMILGGLQLGLIAISRIELQHAVQEGAIAGASEPLVPRRCDVAKATVPRILGRAPQKVRCHAPGQMLVVDATDTVPRLTPFPIPLDISATGRAIVRR
jgi:hypothetical protein